MMTPPTSLPMLDVQDITPRYTDAQLSGDEPIFEATIYGGGTLEIRVVADVVGGEVWPTMQTDGYGALSDETMLEAISAFGRCMGAALRFRAWKEAQS